MKLVGGKLNQLGIKVRATYNFSSHQKDPGSSTCMVNDEVVSKMAGGSVGRNGPPT